MRKLAIAIAVFVAWVCGVNSGYELGADTMQCVAFSSLQLADKSISDDACQSVKQWGTKHPVFLARVAWIELSGQGVTIEEITK